MKKITKMKKKCTDEKLISWLKSSFFALSDNYGDKTEDADTDKFMKKLSDGFYLDEQNSVLNLNRNKFKNYNVIFTIKGMYTSAIHADFVNINHDYIDLIYKTPVKHTNLEKIYRIEEQHAEDLSDTIAVVNKLICFGTREFIITEFIWYRILKKYHMCYFTIYDIEKNTKFIMKTNFNFFDRIFKYDQGNGTYYFE